MISTKVSNEGQIIIPKSIRESLGWDPGHKLSLEVKDDGLFLKLAFDFPESTVEDVLGCLPYEGPTKTLEDMQNAIEVGIRESNLL